MCALCETTLSNVVCFVTSEHRKKWPDHVLPEGAKMALFQFPKLHVHTKTIGPIWTLQEPDREVICQRDHGVCSIE